MSQLCELTLTELDLIAGGGEVVFGNYAADDFATLNGSFSATDNGTTTMGVLRASGTADAQGQFEASFLVLVTSGELPE